MPFAKENIFMGIIGILVIVLLFSLYLYYTTSKDLKNLKQNGNSSTCPNPTCPNPTATCPNPTATCPNPTATCPNPTATCPSKTCPSTQEIVLKNKFIFNFAKIKYLKFIENTQVQWDTATTGTTPVDLLISQYEFKLKINQKYVSIQQLPNKNVTDPNGHIIVLTEKFHFNDDSNKIPGSLPIASLYLDYNNGLCASFLPLYQYTLQTDFKNNIYFNTNQELRFEIRDS
jgi:hypothetical protein